jgi:hypothetical protein
MKGKIECTIPQRQYENIKITYEFDGEVEKKQAIDLIIMDCAEYHQELQRFVDRNKRIESEIAWSGTINGVKHQTIKKGSKWACEAFIDSKWIEVK